MDLKKQSINGAIWSLIDIVINKGAYFIATIILAGVLGPKDFGILGMIMLFISMGNSLVDSGMSTSLLRTKNVSELDYSTVFITNILMSILVYLILFLCAPFIAEFYKESILVKVIRWYCVGFIINSFRSIHNVKLMKEMAFKKIMLLNLPGNIIGVIIGIWLGYAGYGVWSLVFLFLITQIISTVCFWSFISWRPLWKFDMDNYKDHFRFGYKLVISAQLNTIFENIYNVLIGRFYNVTLLGYYERANTFNNYPVSILSGIILKVSLPALTAIKHDVKRLKNAYKNIMQMSYLIASVGLGFAAVIADPLFNIVLGKQWLPAVPLFQILALSYIFYPIHSLNINILSVFGRSDLFLKLEVAKKIVIVLVVAVCFNFGVMGLVWSSVINSLLALIINTYYSGKFLDYNTIDQLKDLLPPSILVAITCSIVYALQMFIPFHNYIIEIFISFIVGLIIFISLCEFFKLAAYNSIKSIILDNIKK
ncbi:lipopolysaccharide biosynthesis protein [uncultured Chryseobacterium sp.]|uniref:lipopolysaccharide biosynthesis protein n=1 Tax=uncultured Chryseobacterium sp. TaxID=259322 RepID=UPI0025E3C47B|nr:lipopolysaccharide biosynthesis protein [uncultured Chryseobacterium sp.]